MNIWDENAMWVLNACFESTDWTGLLILYNFEMILFREVTVKWCGNNMHLMTKERQSYGMMKSAHI